MSDATTALAEVLEAHDLTADGNYRCICGWDGEARSEDVGTFEQHQAAAVVAAVRGLSPDLQAELAPALAEQVVELRAIKEGLESSLTKALTRMSEVRW